MTQQVTLLKPAEVQAKIKDGTTCVIFSIAAAGDVVV